jgi:protein tyrosine phosphatase (PTP) superfamily phosphohydrolase (DUF442 family)
VRVVAAALAWFLLASPVSATAEVPVDARPASWAQPLQETGFPNLFKVSDTLYRSAQPTDEALRNVKNLGIVTVVNLRAFHSDRDELDPALGYEHIDMKTWHPEREDAVRFLAIVTDPNRTPVLLHCKHGSDRTGAMTAIYRVAVQGWTKGEAIREMTEGGYGFHKVWGNLPDWIQELDIDSIREEAGIPPPQLPESPL